MRIQILDAAERDLIKGFRFYEARSSGLGQYFLDTLFADVESLYIYSGIHSQYSGSTFSYTLFVYRHTIEKIAKIIGWKTIQDFL